jgi:CheY-like chemotaxis protein
MSACRHAEPVPLVLIVDDNAGFSASARMLLERGGFQVAEAGTGATGVQSARELAPDLVLLDIQLPDIDGFEVAGRLARLDPRPPVLLISSRAASDYGSLIDQSPTLGFLPKDELSSASIRALVPELDDGRPRQHPRTSGRRRRATSDAYARRARG